ncbi:MAG: hypothetical protein JWL62_1545 [Hyphomicrobiales bacterium]|nr:hypothetical protein [Hyphomicrobiales bacterium]
MKTQKPIPKTKAPEQKPDEKPEAFPAAGPHAHPRLTNPDATPGSGILPEPGPAQNPEGEVEGGAG